MTMSGARPSARDRILSTAIRAVHAHGIRASEWTGSSPSRAWPRRRCTPTSAARRPRPGLLRATDAHWRGAQTEAAEAAGPIRATSSPASSTRWARRPCGTSSAAARSAGPLADSNRAPKRGAPRHRAPARRRAWLTELPGQRPPPPAARRADPAPRAARKRSAASDTRRVRGRRGKTARTLIAGRVRRGVRPRYRRRPTTHEGAGASSCVLMRRLPCVLIDILSDDGEDPLARRPGRQQRAVRSW